MTRDKMKLAYLHPGYWGRALKTHVRPAPQDGQRPHGFEVCNSSSTCNAVDVRRAQTDRKDSLSGVVSSAHILGFQPGRHRTQLRF